MGSRTPPRFATSTIHGMIGEEHFAFGNHAVQQVGMGRSRWEMRSHRFARHIVRWNRAKVGPVSVSSMVDHDVAVTHTRVKIYLVQIKTGGQVVQAPSSFRIFDVPGGMGDDVSVLDGDEIDAEDPIRRGQFNPQRRRF